MIKPYLLSGLLCLAASSVFTTAAHADTDCTMTKYMAGHMLTMLKGGASVEQTASMFEKNPVNHRLIETLAARKNLINNTTEAEAIGLNICLKETSNA
jgi:hypothetical protein